MKGICQPGVVMTFEDATLARGWVHLTLDPLCCPAKSCCACCPERVCPGASGSGAGHLLLVPDWVWKNSMHVIDGEGEVRERRIWLLPLCCPDPASIANTLRVIIGSVANVEPARRDEFLATVEATFPIDPATQYHFSDLGMGEVDGEEETRVEGAAMCMDAHVAVGPQVDGEGRRVLRWWSAHRGLFRTVRRRGPEWHNLHAQRLADELLSNIARHSSVAFIRT